MKRLIPMGLALLVCVGGLRAQYVSWIPAAPRAGDVVSIRYDSRSGPLGPSIPTVWLHWGVLDPETGNWSTPPQAIWPQGSRLHSDNIAVQSPMVRGQDTVWAVTIDFDTTVRDVAFVFTDGSSNWDNNNGNNWEIHFTQPGAVSWWSPAASEPGDVITVFYDAVPGTLPDGTPSAILHWGVNEAGHGNWRLPPQNMWPPNTVPQGVAAQTPMTALGGGLFQIVIATTDSIFSLHYVVTNGSVWDNNGGANWDIFLEEPPEPQYTWEIFRFDPRGAFSTYRGAVNSLNLAGTFNGWSTTATPLTRVDQYGNRWDEVRIPIGTSEYKFVVNGNNWQTDPDNPRTAPGGYNNSLITLEADTLPQVYDVQPGENRVYPAGTAVAVTVRIRPGDLGPGLRTSPEPYALVNGTGEQSTWNSTTSTLTIDALPSAAEYVDVHIFARDSLNRIAERHLAFGFRSTGYLAVDPVGDVIYPLPGVPGDRYDLNIFTARERAGGDSIEFRVMYAADTLLHGPLIVITAAGSADTWSALPNFGGELHVPGLAAGGVAVPLLATTHPQFEPQIHNRIHSHGDFHRGGPPVTFRAQSNPHEYIAVISKSDLESSLGSYQTAWYYTCSAYRAASAAAGYCEEITVDMGGVAGLEEPDAHDAFFYAAADIQTKLMKNYGLTRRATQDAPGRGVAAITPQEIGPNIASPGPLCRILTRGAPTRRAQHTIIGRVTSSLPVTNAWLTQNGMPLPVTLQADTFARPVTLTEGGNQFMLWAVDANGDSGRSPVMTFTLLVDHAPDIVLATRVAGNQGVLDASATTEPQQQPVNFLWTADPGNPTPVALQNAATSVARFDLPVISGEYYFNLTAADPEENTTRARTLFTITSDSAHGFTNNEATAWVMNAMIYEIFPRSHSAAGNLAGITADLPRIADMGFNCLWLMPIFEGPSDHGYEITDYYAVEQDYGTADDLRELVAAAHARGIRVILDMVINHTGIGHPFMQDALRHGRYSYYWDWYDRDANGNYTYYYDWLSLPNLNLSNPETARYFIDMCKYWIEEFDIDGYRCDVAWGPQQRSPQFWVQWRRALKEIKPEVLLLAEAGANNFTIFDERFDLAFDWNLHHEGAASFQNMFPGPPSFYALNDLVTNYGVWWPIYKQPLRFMENHDETRFISENTAAQTRVAASLLLTMPGAVMLYAGQEIGTASQRGLIPWGSDPQNLRSHYYRLTNARRLLPALRTGRFTQLENNQSLYSYSYARHGRGMAPAIFVGNFSAATPVVRITINPDSLGLHPDSTYVISEILSGATVTRQGSQITSLLTSLAAYESKVWVIADTAISVSTPAAPDPLPARIALGEAYPNPFNPRTILPLELSSTTRVDVRLYDILGRETAVLAAGVLPAGRHLLEWDGDGAASGIYFAVLRAGGVHQVRKLAFIR